MCSGSERGTRGPAHPLYVVPLTSRTTETKWSDAGPVSELQTAGAPLTRTVMVEQVDGWRKTVSKRSLHYQRYSRTVERAFRRVPAPRMFGSMARRQEGICVSLPLGSISEPSGVRSRRAAPHRAIWTPLNRKWRTARAYGALSILPPAFSRQKRLLVDEQRQRESE